MHSILRFFNEPHADRAPLLLKSSRQARCGPRRPPRRRQNLLGFSAHGVEARGTAQRLTRRRLVVIGAGLDTPAVLGSRLDVNGGRGLRFDTGARCRSAAEATLRNAPLLLS